MEHLIEPKHRVTPTEASRRYRRKTATVKCQGCGREYVISVDSVRHHRGYCQSCAQRRRHPVSQLKMFATYAWTRRRFWAKQWGTTEGCSFVSDWNFKECCDAHDKHYLLHDVTREQADDELYDCIVAHGHPYVAWVYWSWVRALGWWAWNS